MQRRRRMAKTTTMSPVPTTNRALSPALIRMAPAANPKAMAKAITLLSRSRRVALALQALTATVKTALLPANRNPNPNQSLNPNLSVPVPAPVRPKHPTLPVQTARHLLQALALPPAPHLTRRRHYRMYRLLRNPRMTLLRPNLLLPALHRPPLPAPVLVLMPALMLRPQRRLLRRIPLRTSRCPLRCKRRIPLPVPSPHHHLLFSPLHTCAVGREGAVSLCSPPPLSLATTEFPHFLVLSTFSAPLFPFASPQSPPFVSFIRLCVTLYTLPFFLRSLSRFASPSFLCVNFSSSFCLI